MKDQLSIILIVATILIVSCSAPNNDNSLLNDAAIIHNEAMALAAQLEKQLEEFSADKTIVNDSVLAWRSAIENWEKEVIEVPGNENANHNHAHHDHEKEKAIDLTPEQMLSVQKEMKKQLELIEVRITNN